LYPAPQRRTDPDDFVAIIVDSIKNQEGKVFDESN